MTYKHHIIPFHEWKRRINPKATRKNREFNAPDNVVWLTLEQHIEVHKRLGEEGSKFDEMAYLGLIGSIDKEEIHRRAVKFANTGRTYSLEQKQAQRERGKRLRGIPRPEARGYKHSLEWKTARSIQHKGNLYAKRKHTQEEIQGKSERMKKQSLVKVICPHCNKIGSN